MPHDYLRRILNARVYDVAIETPLEIATALSARTGNTILMKREDLQPVFSFKLRGAYNKMVNCSPEQRARGVIAASAGNHAQGVALAAARLGCHAVIVMPTTTPSVKIDAVRHHGGDRVDIVLHGDSFSDAAAHARILEREHGYTFVHPVDDPDVIAGQGTIGMEMLRQFQAYESQGPLDAVFVAIGGGGLIAGVSSWIKLLRPEVRVIGVQTFDSDAMIRSVEAGHKVDLDDVGLFSDGTAVKSVGTETLRLCQANVDDYVRVDTDEICGAIKDIFLETRNVVEPAGALALAGLKRYASEHGLQGQRLAAIVCGANMNFDRLRFVAERSDVGQAREALFAVSIPEERGSFRRFCELVGTRNVTEFNYRLADSRTARVFVGVSIRDANENEVIASQFRAHGYQTVDLTHNELAAGHIRHMVGGPTPLAGGESLFDVEFPERPGALMQFLNGMAPAWNISLFHYRNQGADYSRVLIGLQVPQEERAGLTGFLEQLGFPWRDESMNPAYHLFLDYAKA
ncbi:threonine ammonia-lyase, biosynthetic [soil metagenome]